MKKTPHYWAVVLTHERIKYGLILEEQPFVLKKIKEAIFKASKEVIDEAIKHSRSAAEQITKENR